jgi:serine/threonine-protein kinase
VSADPQFTEMFIGEAKLVADLVHQYIVQIYQLGKTGSTFYMAMEYVNGVNLDEFMRRHRERGYNVPVDLVTYVISRVCRGLEYAHAKRDRAGHLLGVVHRDISPKNIMISAEGVVKLTDFGIAKAKNLMKDQEGEVLLGKVRYMSPEQSTFQTTDARSDLFSLGVVMYEALSGTALFAGDSTTLALKNVSSRPIPSIRTVRPDAKEEVAAILSKALERDLDKRYQTAGEMANALEQYMYRDRFGPTAELLAKRMSELFPELSQPAA